MSHKTIKVQFFNRDGDVIAEATGKPCAVYRAAPAMLDTLKAIRARIRGEWDAPELAAKVVQYFHVDEDVLKWIDDTLKEIAP